MRLIAYQVTGTLLLIAACSIMSMAMFPPSEVGRQIMVAGIWFVGGILSATMFRR